MDAAGAIAHYVLALERAAASTRRAEDRPNYTALLASAAPLLATALSTTATPGISARAQQHERLWGSLWLSDPAFQEASLAWQAAKAAIGHAGA
jgi:hypothetical protein